MKKLKNDIAVEKRLTRKPVLIRSKKSVSALRLAEFSRCVTKIERQRA